MLNQQASCNDFVLVRLKLKSSILALKPSKTHVLKIMYKVAPVERHGLGCVATQTLKIGQVILTSNDFPALINDEDDLVIPLRRSFFNHSCAANTHAVSIRRGYFELIAVSNIKVNEETQETYQKRVCCTILLSLACF